MEEQRGYKEGTKFLKRPQSPKLRSFANNLLKKNPLSHAFSLRSR